MRKILTDDFWGLNKTMKCAFPLTEDQVNSVMLFTMVIYKKETFS